MIRQSPKWLDLKRRGGGRIEGILTRTRGPLNNGADDEDTEDSSLACAPGWSER